MNRTIRFTEAELVEIEQRSRRIVPMDAEMPEATETVYEWLEQFSFDSDQLKRDIELLVAYVRQTSREHGE